MERKIIPFDLLLEQFGTDKEKAFFARVDEMKDVLDHDDICIKQAKIVTRYVNTDMKSGQLWMPNYNDGSWKYQAAAIIEATDEQPSGGGFSRSRYDSWSSGSNVGVRLCFKSAEDAMWAVDSYPEIYKGWWLPHLFENTSAPAPARLESIRLITEERKRQILEEGFSKEHDNQHVDGQLANAAAYYAMTNETIEFIDEQWGNDMHLHIWPFELTSLKRTPENRVRELTKAGALIAAEIDRLL